MGELKVKIQKFGAFLSGMVMPNIGAFIAWGILTALFIPAGWFPNETMNKLVSPTLTYLMPILLGYTGGKMVYDKRGTGNNGCSYRCGHHNAYWWYGNGTSRRMGDEESR